MWKTLDEKTLKSKKVVELREIAKTFGLQGYEKMKKVDLIANLMREDPKEENSNKDDHDKSVIAGIRSRAATTNRGNHVKAATTTKRGNHVKTVITMNLVKPAKAATTVSKWKAFLNWQKTDSDSLDSTTF